MANVAVFGLGAMGYGIAQSILRAQHHVWGVDLDVSAVDRFQSAGGVTSDLEPGSLDAAVIVVLNADQTEDVLFGATGIALLMKPGAVVLGCATVPPDFARDMAARCKANQIHYLDAPISGGAAKAAAGQLSVMASGTGEAFEAARPILDAMADTVFELGDDAGAGSAMKAVNQMLAGIHIAAMAEAMTFGMTQGIAPADFLRVISKCAGTSWMLENRAPHIVDGDYTPHSSVTIWPKDLGIVRDIAQSAGFDAPITDTALAQYEKAIAMGLGAEDDAAIAKVYAAQAGLTLPRAKN
ncbi:L-threonate dehydrogenase [Cognatiyoonia sp. IB215182]|uniref:L-threonate dehydrogenase n=1 Tax=Cognatiyoonia sp. IB215182 TaxID=3097353 RepID=UPI002A0BA7C1|nr:L-threonate dehydrogenase [Cognatiyoonia sp. IB215182]MDX8353297.1 L-threonate dehydrogenase [Cognatiyoonia sp. IB215182]